MNPREYIDNTEDEDIDKMSDRHLISSLYDTIYTDLARQWENAKCYDKNGKRLHSIDEIIDAMSPHQLLLRISDYLAQNHKA